MPHLSCVLFCLCCVHNNTLVVTDLKWRPVSGLVFYSVDERRAWQIIELPLYWETLSLTVYVSSFTLQSDHLSFTSISGISSVACHSAESWRAQRDRGPAVDTALCAAGWQSPAWQTVAPQLWPGEDTQSESTVCICLAWVTQTSLGFSADLRPICDSEARWQPAHWESSAGRCRRLHLSGWEHCWGHQSYHHSQRAWYEQGLLVKTAHSHSHALKCNNTDLYLYSDPHHSTRSSGFQHHWGNSHLSALPCRWSTDAGDQLGQGLRWHYLYCVYCNHTCLLCFTLNKHGPLSSPCCGWFYRVGSYYTWEVLSSLWILTAASSSFLLLEMRLENSSAQLPMQLGLPPGRSSSLSMVNPDCDDYSSFLLL